MNIIDTLKAPALDKVTQLNVEVAVPIEIGETSQGKRRFIPITGGTFSGQELNGCVLPGGGDWQTIRPDGVAVLQALYILKTDDGVLIEVNNWGYRHGPKSVIEKLQKGEPVDPSEYYFQTTPRFTTASPRYEWLNRSVFIGASERQPNNVIINIYYVN